MCTLAAERLVRYLGCVPEVCIYIYIYILWLLLLVCHQMTMSHKSQYFNSELI
uniref:Uncharacterized protein n=1 Tax=Octopus bimaculoides TaxID=37653 RepID=A0A0L8HEY7_OCTBM